VHALDIDVVRNGTPAVAPTSMSVARTPFPSIAVLGRLVPHKRVDMVLRAVAALRTDLPEVRAFVIGKGYWDAHLRMVAGELGVADSVEFLGWVDEATKSCLLARTWVMAMPSVKEGWGLAVVEAAAHGVPAVGFARAGGLAESIEDGETGLLVANELQFVEAIRLLVRDDGLRTRLGRAARIRAEGFRWDETASAFERVLDASARERARARPWLRWMATERAPGDLPDRSAAFDQVP
jgi:glycosyltransferase involved in cell wall biosynthesis